MQVTARATGRPIVSPINGAKKMKRTVLPMPAHSKADMPGLTNAAPTMPPIRACDELVGRPQYQVTRSHAQAAMRAEAIRRLSTIAGSTIPFPIVAATFRWKTRNAMKLKKAAQMTAICGVSTRVETTVAIAFAASYELE